MVIPVSFEAGTNNTYSLTVSGINHFEATDKIFLEDLKNSSIIDLRQTPSYTFTAKTSDASNRFLLHFKKTVFATEEHPDNNFNIYSYGKNIYVITPALTDGMITVYNLFGQKIKNLSISRTVNKVSMDKSAYYVVVVNGNKTVETKKVFIE